AGVDPQLRLESDLLPFPRVQRAVLARDAEHPDRHRRDSEAPLQRRAARERNRAAHGGAKGPTVKLSVIGAGSFCTAMSVVAAQNKNEIVLWAHDPKVAEAIRDTR